MRKILIVDDDPAVLSFVSKVAESLEYEVRKAGDGIDALIQYGQSPDLDALITDVRMPGVNGFQLAQALRAKNPGLPVLFISGYYEESGIETEMSEREGIHFLPKPFTPQQLGTALILLFVSGSD